MDADEITDSILQEFKWLHPFSALTQDPTTRGNSLLLDCEQNPSGNYLVERRGCLYLSVKEGDEYIVSVSQLWCMYVHMQ